MRARATHARTRSRAPTDTQALPCVADTFGHTGHASLQLEGSDDGVHWQPLLWRYNPHRVDAAPRMFAPLHPRVDHQAFYEATGLHFHLVDVEGGGAGRANSW